MHRHPTLASDQNLADNYDKRKIIEVCIVETWRKFIRIGL